MDSAAIVAARQEHAHAWGTDIAERIIAEGGGTAAAADLARMAPLNTWGWVCVTNAQPDQA